MQYFGVNLNTVQSHPKYCFFKFSHKIYWLEKLTIGRFLKLFDINGFSIPPDDYNDS